MHLHNRNNSSPETANPRTLLTAQCLTFWALLHGVVIMLFMCLPPGVPLDVVGGTSQGAFMAALYAQGLGRTALQVKMLRSCLFRCRCYTAISRPQPCQRTPHTFHSCVQVCELFTPPANKRCYVA